MIRKAQTFDIDNIEAIYARIHSAEEVGETTTGWLREVYPVRQTALDALERGDLYVMEEEGEIVAAAIINQIQPDSYRDCPWQRTAEDGDVLVLHTLTVDPQKRSKGFGTSFVRYYEQQAAERRCTALRMDTNARNMQARRLYAHLGYREAGIVPCEFNGIPGVQLVCLEKPVK